MLLLLGGAIKVGLAENLVILHGELVSELVLFPSSSGWGRRRLRRLCTLDSDFPNLLGELKLNRRIRTGQLCRIGYVFLRYVY